MAEKKNIYESIHAVMEEVGAIGKQKRNAQQGFLYRGIDDVMNALNPALINHRLFIVPEVLEHRREERQTVKGGNLIYSVCRVKYTFYAEDGSHVEAVVVGCLLSGVLHSHRRNAGSGRRDPQNTTQWTPGCASNVQIAKGEQRATYLTGTIQRSDAGM